MEVGLPRPQHWSSQAELSGPRLSGSEEGGNNKSENNN